MQFTVLATGAKPTDSANNCAFLVTDNADDWGKFTTQYTLIVFDSAGMSHTIGAVKIGESDMAEGQMRAAIPETFESLGTQFFSLGQDDTYYEQLNGLKKATRENILRSLRDIAADDSIYKKAIKEAVTTESLLRLVTGATVQNQFRRLAKKGGDRLTPYEFKYTGPKVSKKNGGSPAPIMIDFKVLPDSNPPTNIHVLIGPNGVGKTSILEWMAHATTESKAAAGKCGVFEQINAANKVNFAGLVSVTFSAFDPFDPLPDRRGEGAGMRYSYVGLKSTSKSHPPGTLKNLKILTGDFTKSLQACVTGVKAERWREAMETLESDPSFLDQDVSALLDDFIEDDGSKVNWDEAMESLANKATDLFMCLSTGHKIALLTITRLVETVEERTLVLFDEPESHLHPPLLSAFVRAISDLLIKRNGVAILATHSPVVLQEVPSSCVWKLRRYGGVVKAERPDVETFGENVGVLTREVFGLDITKSGFHNMVCEVVESADDYDAVIEHFSDQLGTEARAVARGLIAVRDEEKDK
jgi:predicted ATPase